MKKSPLVVIFVILSFLAWSCSKTTEADSSFTQPDRNSADRTIEAASTALNQTSWRAATFNGIRVGSDNRQTVLRVLGNPVWTGTPFDESGNANVEELVRDEFDIKDGFHSRIAVISNRRNGLVIDIEGSLARIPIESVLKKFGSSYQRKTYTTIFCDPEDPNSEVLVESDDNDSNVYYIYPELGIVIPTSDDSFVNTIEYRSQPLVSKKQACKTD